MSTRVEWELVPRVREEKRAEVEAIAREILELDAVLELEPASLTQAEENRLIELQTRMAACIQSPCEAASAPLLSERTALRRDAEAVLGELPTQVPEDEFLAQLGDQHDCARCPGRTAYPGVSGVPCEFDLSPLNELVEDEAVLETVQFELDPEQMITMADNLSFLRAAGMYRVPEGLDVAHYLNEAISFLRFWSGLGFGVAPAYVDEL